MCCMTWGRSLNLAVDGPGGGRLHPGYGLADHRGAGLASANRKAHDPRAQHLQDSYVIMTCPPVFNVRLFEGDNYEDSIHRSKAVESRRCCCRSRCSSRFAMWCRLPASTG